MVFKYYGYNYLVKFLVDICTHKCNKGIAHKLYRWYITMEWMYSDEEVLNGINKAIKNSNRCVSTKDIIFEIVDMPWGLFHKRVPVKERRYLALRINWIMKDLYECINKNSTSTTWLVKP